MLSCRKARYAGSTDEHAAAGRRQRANRAARPKRSSPPPSAPFSPAASARSRWMRSRARPASRRRRSMPISPARRSFRRGRRACQRAPVWWVLGRGARPARYRGLADHDRAPLPRPRAVARGDRAQSHHRRRGHPLSGARRRFSGRPGRSAQRAQIEAFLRRAAEAGSLAIPDPRLAAEQFVALARGEIHLRSLLRLEDPGDPAALDAAAANSVATFLRAFQPG